MCIRDSYRLYEASDGWVFLAAPAAREWDRLVAALRPWADLAPGGSDATVAALLTEAFRLRPAEEWEVDLTGAGVACVAVARGPVEDHLMGDTGIGRRCGLVTEVDHPVIGTHTRLTAPVTFSRSSTRTGAAALVGHHTDAVLQELGYPPARIAELRAAGVVG